MKYTKKLRELGISEKDFSILRALDTGGESKISPLTEVLSLPRTTISFRLKKMKQRDLVKQVVVGGHYEWTITAHAKELLVGVVSKDEFHAAHYKTAESIQNIFKQILSDKSDERIYFIEPYVQTKSFISKTKTGDIVDLTKLFRRHRNISEGVSSSKNIELIKNYDKKVMESMVGRMAIVYVVPDEYLDFEDMILVYKDTVYNVNFDKNLVIEIQNRSFARSMRSIVLALRSFGKKIDLNQYVREELNRRNS